jgi:hypothetical protein
VDAVGADQDVAFLRAAAGEPDAHATVGPLEAGARAAEPKRALRQRRDECLLEIRAVHAEHLPAAGGVGELAEHPPAPVQDERVPGRVAAPANLARDPEPLERGDGVRRERDPGADGLERGGALEDERLVPRARARSHYEIVSLNTSGRW